MEKTNHYTRSGYLVRYETQDEYNARKEAQSRDVDRACYIIGCVVLAGVAIAFVWAAQVIHSAGR